MEENKIPQTPEEILEDLEIEQAFRQVTGQPEPPLEATRAFPFVNESMISDDLPVEDPFFPEEPVPEKVSFWDKVLDFYDRNRQTVLVSTCAVALLLIVAVIGEYVVALFGISTFNLGGVLEEDTIRQGLDLVGGSSVTFKAIPEDGKDLTSDEIGIILRNYFMLSNIDIKSIKGTIISSVVPPIMYSLTHAVRKYVENDPIVVNSKSKMGLTIKYDNPKEVGADRLVNAVGAINKYKAPVIIVDFGTATTFCAINKENEYLGGVILPGIKISLNALVEKTAKLPRIEIAKPEKIIGTSTVESMQSGMYYGYAGSVDNIVKKMKSELAYDDVTVIATGGLARMIAKESETIDVIDSGLTLEGLKIIYKNETEGKETK